jgi:DNA-binding XRE family transcriptional regulator
VVEISLVRRNDASFEPRQRKERENTVGIDDAKTVVDLGARLHELRKRRRLTLQEISTLTGVSASTVSKIERNDLSPTFSTLERIARGLGVELVTLLTDQNDDLGTFGGRRSITRAGEGSRHTTGNCNNMLLCSDLKNKRATPVLTTVKARSPDEYPAWAKSEAEIFVMVLKGTLLVHSRLYEPLELNEGDSIYYDATTEHTWTSSGPADAVVLWTLINL